ncbi:MAG: TRAP transporter small permease subunit [Paracoccaceae bacterium]
MRRESGDRQRSPLPASASTAPGAVFSAGLVELHVNHGDVMGFLLNLANVFDRIARSVGKAAGWIIMLLIFVIMFDVITRKVDLIRLSFSDISINYGYSISTILQDLEWHFHGVLLLLTFGFGYLMNAHVRVDIFRENLSRKKQAWMEFFALVLMAIPFLVIMLYFTWRFVVISYGQGEGSESMTGIPWRYVIKAFMPIGILVALMAAVATLIRLIAYLFGAPDHKARAHGDMSIFAHEDPASKALEEAHAQAERAAHEIRREMRDTARRERRERREAQNGGGR